MANEGPITLIEASKLAQTEGKTYLGGVIAAFPETSEILRVLPFMNIQGTALKYDREETLPNPQFRAINQGYTNTKGDITSLIETISIFGDQIEIDTFLINTLGESARTTQKLMKFKAMALAWTRVFFKGDNTSNPKEFTGIQKRITDDQLISAGTTSGGAALSLEKLDELIDSVDNATHLIMNKAMARRLSQSARDPNISGIITFDKSEYGKPIQQYNGLPILTVGRDNFNDEMLGFNEAAYAGSPTATSIYCLSIGDLGVMGLQNGGFRVIDIPENSQKPVETTRVEWYTSLTIFQKRSAARLQHIGNLPVVV